MSIGAGSIAETAIAEPSAALAAPPPKKGSKRRITARSDAVERPEAR